jgi:hypothetical protein
MSLTAPTKGGDGKPFEVLPAGTWRGVIAAVIDLGSHYKKFKAKKEGEKDSEGWRREIYVVIQTAKRKTDGTPFYIGHQYTLSLVDTANLRGVYVALIGPVPASADADVTCLLGKPCSVQVTNTTKGEKVYANVKAIGPYPADDETPAPPKPAEPPLLYLLAGGQPFEEPAWMPRIYGQKVADVIAMSRERGGGNNLGGNGQQAQGPAQQQPAAAGAAAKF